MLDWRGLRFILSGGHGDLAKMTPAAHGPTVDICRIGAEGFNDRSVSGFRAEVDCLHGDKLNAELFEDNPGSPDAGRRLRFAYQAELCIGAALKNVRSCRV
jgi:hypothetical protein